MDVLGELDPDQLTTNQKQKALRTVIYQNQMMQ